RVTAPLTWTSRQRARLERKTGRMREEVPHRRAFRSGLFVEVDHSFLRGDKCRQSWDELRQRGPPDYLAGSSARRHDLPVAQHSDSREWSRPAVDLTKCCFHRRAILVPWIASWSPPARLTNP